MKTLFVLLLSLFSVLATDTALKEFTNGNKLFTAAIYKEILKNDKENFLVSPFSAEIVLAFAQSGAKNQTAQELRTGLHLPISQEKVESVFKALLPSLKSNKHYSLNTANKIYVKQKYQIKDEFKKIATDVFQAESENIDFTPNNAAAKKMNEWMEKKTEYKIHNLIDPKVLDDKTVSILINSLYFKGNWSKPFNKFMTQKEAFYQTAKNVVQVDTMYSMNQFYNYFESEELNSTFLEIPFEGEDISMTIVLPNEKEGLWGLEGQIERVFLPQEFTKEAVNVALPKFKVETELDFKEILPYFGVIKAFIEGGADFSGIAGVKGEIFISNIIQKTLIDVTEDGVEAAATTYAEFFFRSGHILPHPPIAFVADHPFLFYIKVKKIILFAGRVLLPGK